MVLPVDHKLTTNIMSKPFSRLALVFGLMVTCSGNAQELGDFSMQEHDHAGWQQTNVFISPDKTILSFDWNIVWHAYHGQGNPSYVIDQTLSVGYDNRVLGHGPWPDNGVDEVYLWSASWRFVGSESTNIPLYGFVGHQDLDLGALAGRTVSLWFYLDYNYGDYANDSLGLFNNVALVPAPEAASHKLLALGLCTLAALKRNRLLRFVVGNLKIQAATWRR